MKEFFEKLDKEKVFAGVFGLIAIVAILCEMKLGSFDSSSIAGGVKDIAGIALDVIMLFVALSVLKPKRKLKGFQEAFTLEMEKIMEKYNPMVTFFGKETTQKVTDAYRYNIANKLNCLTTNDPGGNNKFFRIKEGMNEVEFSVSATVFADRKETVSSLISSAIKKSHDKFVTDNRLSKEGFVLIMKNPLQSREDAEEFAKIVDHILMLYTVEYSKNK